MLPRLLLLAALLSLPAHADAAEGDEVIDRARAMMEEGERMREMIEERYLRAQIECYDRFFVNHCLNKARRTRNTELEAARELEIGGKRMELAERQRRAAEHPSSIDMSPGRSVPQPNPDILPQEPAGQGTAAAASIGNGTEVTPLQDLQTAPAATEGTPLTPLPQQ